MENFIKQLAEILEVETFDIDGKTNFKEVDNWDSLAQLSVLTLAEDEYNKVITAEELNEANDVNALFAIVTG